LGWNDWKRWTSQKSQKSWKSEIVDTDVSLSDPQASELNQSVFYEKTVKPILDAADDAGMISRLPGGDYG
jgi:hypothetical protein